MFEPKNEQQKKCIICGVEFFPKHHKCVTCGSGKCMKENYKRKAQKKHEEKVKTDFSKGAVYVLDEEKWIWHKENRK